METLITGDSVLFSLEEHLNLSGDTARCFRIGAPRLLTCTAGLGLPTHDSRGFAWELIHQHYMVRPYPSREIKQSGKLGEIQAVNSMVMPYHTTPILQM